MRPDERFPTNRTASSGSRVPPAEITTRRPFSAGRSVNVLENPLDNRRDLLGLGHSPGTDLALGELSLNRSDDLDAAGAQGLDVRARRRVLPHAGVHRRCDEHRARHGREPSR